MPFRDPRDRVPDERTPSVLEQRLQVTREARGLSVEHDNKPADSLTVWRPHVEAAKEDHHAQRGRRRRYRNADDRRRARLLWVLALVLIWATVAAITGLLLRYGQL